MAFSKESSNSSEADSYQISRLQMRSAILTSLAAPQERSRDDPPSPPPQPPPSPANWASSPHLDLISNPLSLDM
ncbi:hypothetical protein BU26DRAFT_567572 [Trematosphaeria pertusa]|uniref:Uncharacterized protein n=1 Tax=Trematosphaeria pertusa TaxID=390896 RepID=A0A6A6I6U8_9PLEO|nr:uncharacterized protein BU26DRAFT_567572 [Trematosphaeria pertusa]KAF2246066.1 hypothetical protein BU26DRAFT_567572 [Trematosphaeria pertusa]